ncbi:MAG: hypothetical protein ACI936_003444 [Paraglaciecola sp.]
MAPNSGVGHRLTCLHALAYFTEGADKHV